MRIQCTGCQRDYHDDLTVDRTCPHCGLRRWVFDVATLEPFFVYAPHIPCCSKETDMSTNSEGGMAYVRNPGDLREALADVQHCIWSHWMQYQFSCCHKEMDVVFLRGDDTGALIIPAEKVERWQRQTNQHYDMLSEKERNSDREQADKILALLNRPELLPALQALVMKLQKAQEPFNLQRELTRLRRESGVDMVVNERKTLWRVTWIQDTTFSAHQSYTGGLYSQPSKFDQAQVSEHDLQFLLVGAEFYAVSARESTIHGQTGDSERLVFVPIKKAAL